MRFDILYNIYLISSTLLYFKCYFVICDSQYHMILICVGVSTLFYMRALHGVVANCFGNTHSGDANLISLCAIDVLPAVNNINKFYSK